MGIFEISHGTINSSFANPRETFIRALLCGAAHFILLHNHVSGDVTPSKEDVRACNRIFEMGKMMGVELCDFIVIGDGYYSFREENILSKP